MENKIATNDKRKNPNDTFNADEKGLVYRCTPDKTLAFIGERCRGGKQCKKRITLLCKSLNGSEKLTLLMIGKSAKLRCFENVKLNSVLKKMFFF